MSTKTWFFLPEQTAMEFAQAIDGVLVRWSFVANASDSVGENIWNTPTKLQFQPEAEKLPFLNA